MTDIFQQFEEKFRVTSHSIIRFNHWTWSVRPVHCTLGASILSLNRACISFGGISRQEAAELADINHEIENRLRKTFSPEKFNYLMLMMVDPHVHFHVIPRYQNSREFGGIQWIDSGWPALPALDDGVENAESPALQSIARALKDQN